ncbi:MAG: hypothetical protein ACRDEA_23385, partial [Microcystaceae cyanobacterium]
MKQVLEGKLKLIRVRYFLKLTNFILLGQKTMKINNLLLLSATSLLASTLPVLSYTAEVSANSSSPVVPLTATVKETNSTVANKEKNQLVAVMSGTFVAAEKNTTGTAK